jgi:translocator protein
METMSAQATPSRSFFGHPFVSLVLFLLVVFAVAFVAGMATMEGMPVWYQTLAQPAWSPPNWVFSPVWTLLYTLMGVAAWMVWRTPARGEPGADADAPAARTKSWALGAFWVQLALNGLWSWVFFGWRQLSLAAIEIALLNVALAITIWMFWRVRRTAAWLLVPYQAWILFAMALNIAIARLNA